MSFDHRIGPEGRDDDVIRALRRLYAAPAAAEYWRALEARIVARALAGEHGAPGDAWWLSLARWGGRGVAAAAVAVAVAGATLWRAREVREHNAVTAVMLQANAPRAQLAAATGDTPDGDAVLRDLLAP